MNLTADVISYEYSKGNVGKADAVENSADNPTADS